MKRTKYPLTVRTRTKFKKEKIKIIHKNCPPKSTIWFDEKGKLHKGLLTRSIQKAKKKKLDKLIYISPETKDKTIFIFKK